MNTAHQWISLNMPPSPKRLVHRACRSKQEMDSQLARRIWAELRSHRSQARSTQPPREVNIFKGGGWLFHGALL